MLKYYFMLLSKNLVLRKNVVKLFTQINMSTINKLIKKPNKYASHMWQYNGLIMFFSYYTKLFVRL